MENETQEGAIEKKNTEKERDEASKKVFAAERSVKNE